MAHRFIGGTHEPAGRRCYCVLSSVRCLESRRKQVLRQVRLSVRPSTTRTRSTSPHFDASHRNRSSGGAGDMPVHVGAPRPAVARLAELPCLAFCHAHRSRHSSYTSANHLSYYYSSCRGDGHGKPYCRARSHGNTIGHATTNGSAHRPPPRVQSGLSAVHTAWPKPWLCQGPGL